MLKDTLLGILLVSNAPVVAKVAALKVYAQLAMMVMILRIILVLKNVNSLVKLAIITIV